MYLASSLNLAALPPLARLVALCGMTLVAMACVGCVIGGVAIRRADPNDLPAMLTALGPRSTGLRSVRIGESLRWRSEATARSWLTANILPGHWKRQDPTRMDRIIIFLVNRLVLMNEGEQPETARRQPFDHRTGHAAPIGQRLRATQMGVVVGVAR